jgi:chemotaxis protein methyltransferase CheR
MTPDLLVSAAGLVERRLGFVIPRLYFERLERGLGRAQTALGAASAKALLARLPELPLESKAWQAVIDAVTVNETNFLRHPQWFAEIGDCVLRPLIEARREQGLKHLDLWSAGCSTGEEPYTLAMMVSELLPDRRDWTIRILATDIDMTAMGRAKEGIYRSWAVRELAPVVLKKWFSKVGADHYRVSPHLQQMVEFRMLNLSADSYPNDAAQIAQFDLVLCRNVLIYLSEAQQTATAARLVRSLAQGGWLSVAPAEPGEEEACCLTLFCRTPSTASAAWLRSALRCSLSPAATFPIAPTVSIWRSPGCPCRSRRAAAHRQAPMRAGKRW